MGECKQSLNRLSIFSVIIHFMWLLLLRYYCNKNFINIPAVKRIAVATDKKNGFPPCAVILGKRRGTRDGCTVRSVPTGRQLRGYMAESSPRQHIIEFYPTIHQNEIFAVVILLFSVSLSRNRAWKTENHEPLILDLFAFVDLSLFIAISWYRWFKADSKLKSKP